MIAHVNSSSGGVQNGDSATTIASAAASHTAGNFLGLSISCYGAVTVTGVVDTAGNTYTSLTLRSISGNDDRQQLWYAYNILGHASNIVTVTFSASVPYREVIVEQFSGLQTSSDPFDVEAFDENVLVTDTLESVTFSTAQAEELLFVGAYAPNPSGFTAQLGYTLLQSQPNSSSAGDLYEITSAIKTNYTAKALTGVNISRWVINVAAFKGATSSATAVITGTGGGGMTEAEVVAGAKTLIITLTNDTWVAAGGTFDAQRQNIINGFVSAQSEGTGFNALRSTIAVTAMVRTSGTVGTLTLPALATFNITANETLTDTVPASALTGATQVVATPQVVITAAGGVGVPRGGMALTGAGA